MSPPAREYSMETCICTITCIEKGWFASSSANAEPIITESWAWSLIRPWFCSLVVALGPPFSTDSELALLEVLPLLGHHPAWVILKKAFENKLFLVAERCRDFWRRGEWVGLTWFYLVLFKLNSCLDKAWKQGVFCVCNSLRVFQPKHFCQ